MQKEAVEAWRTWSRKRAAREGEVNERERFLMKRAFVSGYAACERDVARIEIKAASRKFDDVVAAIIKRPIDDKARRIIEIEKLVDRIQLASGRSGIESDGEEALNELARLAQEAR